jgi:hypothetical protein
MLLGVWDSVRELALTFPSELPLWEFKSQWTLEFSENDCRGQNPLDWRVSYIIEKLLEPKCLKWARMTHLDTWNTSYGQKKDRESNWQFDSQPLKVRNRPNFLTCRWRATYHWKALDKGYNFASDLISIGGLHTMLWAPEVVGGRTMGISRFPLGSPRTKWHLGDGPVTKHRIYYKGEGGGFPSIQVVVNFTNPCLPMAHVCSKVF